jgi:choice-of-anchor B domain-containing protein
MRRALYLIAASVLVATPVQAQQFGASAAIGESEIYIGEPVNQSAPTTIHIYRRAGDGWTEAGTLTAPDAGEESNYFGRFIVLDDQSMIVGGTTYEGSTGNAWVYRRSGDGWEFVQNLRPDDVIEGDSYGRFGLLHGNLLFVSALGHNESRGAVWVFQRDASGAWTQEAKLEPVDAPSQEFFGWSLAFDGERLLTGAIQASQELQQRGAAYIFRRNGPGDWVQEAKLTLAEDEAEAGDIMGYAVGWLDGQALVGVPGRGPGVGEVRTYRWDRGTGEWAEGVTLSAHDRTSGGQFGTSLTAREGELWVGAPGADLSGSVYRIEYDAETDRFGNASKLAGLEGDVGDGFGNMIAGGADIAVIGATGDDFGLGSAVIVERDGDSWSAAEKLFGPDPAGLASITGDDVRCEDGQADQFECSQVDILSFLPVAGIGGGRGAETNDVWGWTDAQTGREYALVGRTDGTAFIDVTDANDPVYLGNLPKTLGSRGNAWRDIKVYKDHAFIVADGAGEHGMQVFDLTRLRDVTNAPVTFDEDAHYDGIASAHNIVINEESGFAYGVGVNSGGETCGGGLHMIDIQEPTQPTFRGCFADPATGNNSTGYSHDALCIGYDGPDTEHAGKEICFGSNETALSIADVTDKDNPVAISSADYPNVGYAHQGWITEDHRYFFMNDEGDESNSVQDPVMVKEHFGSTFTIDHNLYIKGDLMYQSNYVSGLRILDVSDPENPVEVGFFDTVPWSEEVTFDGSWSNYPFFESGTIVVTSGKEGVFFLKHRRPELVP